MNGNLGFVFATCREIDFCIVGEQVLQNFISKTVMPAAFCGLLTLMVYGGAKQKLVSSRIMRPRQYFRMNLFAQASISPSHNYYFRRQIRDVGHGKLALWREVFRQQSTKHWTDETKGKSKG